MVAGYGAMHDITSVKVKREAMAARESKEVQMASRIDALVRSGEMPVDEEDGSLRGCGGRFFCGLFGKRRGAKGASLIGAAAGEQRARTGAEARIFGQKGKASTAADRLNHAAESVEAHAGQLGERARAARAKAKELFAANKRPEAMAALKRAKALDKQLETASATHAALERQVDVLAESALQKEVASALSASVASTKKKTKGLMSKTEDAVDGATELKVTTTTAHTHTHTRTHTHTHIEPKSASTGARQDFAEDIAQTLGTLQTDTFDDDELLEELEAMQIGDDVDVVVDTDERTPVVAAAAPVVTPASVGVVVVDPSSYPRVPTRVVERHKLLADDGAALAHEDALTSGDAM